MAARNSEIRYGNVAMAFHWIIALLLITNIGLGLYMSDLPRSDPSKMEVFQLHKSVGLTVLVLSFLRLGWRLINTVPPLPLGMHPVVAVLARITHIAFYVLIIIIPLSGWTLVSASPLGNGTAYFGLFNWPNLPFFHGMARADLRSYREMLESTHVFLAWTAIVLVPIHVAAALYHQFLRRDDVLRRMLPWTQLGGDAL